MLAEKMRSALAHAKERDGLKRQEEFALRVGMSPERLKNILAGRIKKLMPEEAKAIEGAYGVRRIWWVNDEAPMLLTPEELQAGPVLAQLEALSDEAAALGLDGWHARVASELVLNWRAGRGESVRKCLDGLQPVGELDDFVTLPRHAVAASAGGGALISDDAIVDHLAFKRTWITQALGLDPAHVAVIAAKGDSMNPTIDSGDLLLLDTRHAQARNEGIYVIRLGEALLVKRLRIKLTGVVEVMSDNPRYQTEVLSGAALDQLMVVGRVVWHGRRV